MEWLLGALNPIAKIASALEDAFETLKNAESEQAQIAANERIASLNGRLAVLQDKQKSPVFWWIWGALAGLVVLYFGKIILYDTMLGWGTTPELKGQAALLVTLVLDSIFITGGAVASVGIVANAIARWKR